MIGKMYRPLSVKTLQTPRGFSFDHKMKSNYGGVQNFVKEVALTYNWKNKTQNIQIVLKDIDRPILLQSSDYKPLSRKKAKSKKGLRNFQTYRRILRPRGKLGPNSSYMSMKDGALFIQFSIESEDDPKENELLKVIMKPVIFNQNEYLEINTEGKTAIEFESGSSIHYQ